MKNMLFFVLSFVVTGWGPQAKAESPTMVANKVPQEMVRTACEPSLMGYIGAWAGKLAFNRSNTAVQADVQVIFSKHACVKDVYSEQKYLVGLQTIVYPAEQTDVLRAEETVLILGENEFIEVDSQHRVARYTKATGGIDSPRVAWVSDDMEMLRHRIESHQGDTWSFVSKLETGKLVRLNFNRSLVFNDRIWNYTDEGNLVGSKIRGGEGSSDIQCVDAKVPAFTPDRIINDPEHILGKVTYNLAAEVTHPASAERYGEIYLGDDFPVDPLTMYQSPEIFSKD